MWCIFVEYEVSRYLSGGHEKMQIRKPSVPFLRKNPCQDKYNSPNSRAIATQAKQSARKRMSLAVTLRREKSQAKNHEKSAVGKDKRIAIVAKSKGTKTVAAHT